MNSANAPNVNNILALKGKTTSNTSNKMDVNGDASLAKVVYTQDKLDTTTYSKSLNGEEITNQLSSADINLYEGIKKGTKIKTNPLVSVVKAVCTFILIDFTWVFFRANTLADAMYVFQNLFSDISLWFTSGYFRQMMEVIGFYTNNGVAIFWCILFMFAVELWEGKSTITDRLNKCNVVVRWGFYYAIIALIMFFGYFGQSQFIYFQF